MRHDRFDVLTKALATSASRRSALRGLAGGGAAALLVGVGRSPVRAVRGAPVGDRIASPAAPATPATSAPPASEAQARLDALGADTMDSIAQALWLPELHADALPADVLARLIDPKNANRAFGDRLTARITELAANPDSYTPSYRNRYAVLLGHS